MALNRATVADALELARTIRQEDRAEIEVQGLEVEASLRLSVTSSDLCVALRLGGELAALAGVRAMPRTLLGRPTMGCAWLLTGEACNRHRVSFVRAAKEAMPRLAAASGCDELRNWVDARYTGALNLLDRLGYVRLGTYPYGASGEPFVLVSLRR